MRWSQVTILMIAQVFALRSAAQEAGDAGAGAVYAQRVCSECHAVIKDEAYSPNPDAPPFDSIAETHGMSEQAIRIWLQSSHKDMPNIMVEPQDREDVAAYIMSLKAKP